jgi:hypothetical protein
MAQGHGDALMDGVSVSYVGEVPGGAAVAGASALADASAGAGASAGASASAGAGASTGTVATVAKRKRAVAVKPQVPKPKKPRTKSAGTPVTSAGGSAHGSAVRAKKSDACPVLGCDKICRDNGNLQEHIRTDHTGDRPYRCQFRCKADDPASPLELRCRVDDFFRTSAKSGMTRHEHTCGVNKAGGRLRNAKDCLPFDSLIIPGMDRLGALGSAAAQAAYSTALALHQVVSDLEVAGSEPAVIQAAHILADDAVNRAQLLTDALKLAPLVKVDKAPESARDTPCACLSISDAARAACGCGDPARMAARQRERSRIMAAMLALHMNVPWYIGQRTQ